MSSYVVGVYSGIAVDLLINTIFEPPLGDAPYLLAILGVQLAVLFGVTLFVYTLFTSTRLFRQGLIGKLLGQHKAYLGIFLVNFALFFAAKLYRVVAALDYDQHLDIWSAPGFFPLYTLQRLFTLAYYYSTLSTCKALVAQIEKES